MSKSTKVVYSHLFNSSTKRGEIDLYLTTTPSLAGAERHSTHPNKRTASQAASDLGAKPWNH